MSASGKPIDNERLPISSSGGEPPAALPIADTSGGSPDIQRFVESFVRQEGSRKLEIPGYRIDTMIATGGMGSVYRAVQLHPLRPAAVKVIKPGIASPILLRRFELEAQALAMLQHPGIAQIYEAGTFEMGDGPQPFFAMELVDGPPLHEFIAAKNPSVRDRLELLAKLADAIQHAHQKGVIHRDLKPGNILVAAGAEPKVLDFGVARLAADDDAAAGLQTQAGQLLGTIPYMSPEQFLGSPGAIDTRTDIYALGVIGYEMLAGRRPLKLDGLPQAQAARMALDEAPEPLGKLNAACRGDIETIIGKALEKEKERRYAAAADLAADIRRHLANEPIVARPPTAFYVIKKFARRNRALAASAAAALLSIVAGASLAVWQAHVAASERDEAREQRRRADAEAAVAGQVSGFMLGLFKTANPNEARGGQVTAREMLDHGAAEIDEKLAGQAEVRARMLATMSDAYYFLGLLPRSLELAEKALEATRQAHGKGSLEEADALMRLGNAQGTLGAPKLALPAFEECLRIRQARLPASDPAVLRAMEYFALGRISERKPDEGIGMLRRAIALHEGAGRPDDGELAQMLGHLGEALMELKRSPEEVEPLFRRALAAQIRSKGEAENFTPFLLTNLARWLHRQKRDAEAEPLLLKSLEIRLKLYGETHEDTLLSLHALATHMNEVNKDKDAAAGYFRRALAVSRSVHGEGTLEEAEILSPLSAILWFRGEREEAKEMGLRSAAIRREVNGEGDKTATELTKNLAMALVSAGRKDEAAAIVRELLDARLAALGESHPQTVATMELLSGLLASKGDKEEGLAMRRRAEELRKGTD